MRISLPVALTAFVHAVLPSTVRAEVPNPDLRIAIDVAPLQQAVRGFQHYKMGQWMQFGEFKCGDRNVFWAIVREPPFFGLAQWRDGALPGTTIRAALDVRAELNGCFFDPRVDARAELALSVGRLNGGQVAVPGSFGGTFGPYRWNVPFSLTIKLPAELSTVSVTVSDGADYKLEFGTGSVDKWTPTSDPKTRQVPISVRVSSFGGDPANQRYLIVDGTVGSERVFKLANAAAEQKFHESDLPLWEGRNLGVTVRDSFFGEAAPGKAPAGLLGQILPMRAKLTLQRKILSWNFEREADIVFDGASVRHIQHDGSDAFEVMLSSSSAQVGGTRLAAADGKFLSGITGRVVLDRLRVEEGIIRFRVADFRVLVESSVLLIPVKFSSGALESALNGGKVDLGRIADTALSLPGCVDAGEKFISTPGACGEPVQRNGIIGKLGYKSGKREIVFKPNASSLALRWQGSEVEGTRWTGLQAGISIAVE